MNPFTLAAIAVFIWGLGHQRAAPKPKEEEKPDDTYDWMGGGGGGGTTWTTWTTWTTIDNNLARFGNYVVNGIPHMVGLNAAGQLLPSSIWRANAIADGGKGRIVR